tara:strand:- start:7851 stop:7994 length:144 start_codon:yes stop_codon:yes gene_type:complete
MDENDLIVAQKSFESLPNETNKAKLVLTAKRSMLRKEIDKREMDRLL